MANRSIAGAVKEIDDIIFRFLSEDWEGICSELGLSGVTGAIAYSSILIGVRHGNLFFWTTDAGSSLVNGNTVKRIEDALKKNTMFGHLIKSVSVEIHKTLN